MSAAQLSLIVLYVMEVLRTVFCVLGKASDGVGENPSHLISSDICCGCELRLFKYNNRYGERVQVDTDTRPA